MTARERGLLKGAIRRVFSRSDLRKEALNQSYIEHTDSTRPRVKKWSRCPECKKATPTYLMQVDHQHPVVPLDKTLEDMSWDDVINNMWCETVNLIAMCKECHAVKTGQERKIRLRLKKENKK